MFDEETLYKVRDIISTEARANTTSLAKHNDRDIFKGLNLWSPNINISVIPDGDEDRKPTVRIHISPHTWESLLQKDFKVIQMCLKPLPALSILQHKADLKRHGMSSMQKLQKGYG